MTHVGPLPPIWDLLDSRTSSRLVRNAFVILRMVATIRYPHLKSQELHEALMTKTWRRRSTSEVRPQQVALLTDQFAAMSTKYQEVLAAAASDAERARLAE
jgi:hypothetical protein